MHAIVSDFEVVKGTATWPHPANREFTASRCVVMSGQVDFGGPVFLGDEMIGLIGIRDQTLGYMYARKHWGQGYAGEMAGALIARAFGLSDTAEINAGFWADNPASGRVLEKLGFAATGPSVQFCAARGQNVDGIDMVLSRAVWLAANPLRIETERLTIHAFGSDDIAAFHAIARQQQVSRMLQSVAHPLSFADAASWIDSRRYSGRVGFCAGVYLPDDRLIGAVGIGGNPVSTMFFFDPAQWGHGYATEAMRGFLSAIMVQFGLLQIVAGAMPDNPASQRVLTKLGFEKTHRDQQQSTVRLEPDPCIMYRLSRQQFEAAK